MAPGCVVYKVRWDVIRGSRSREWIVQPLHKHVGVCLGTPRSDSKHPKCKGQENEEWIVHLGFEDLKKKKKKKKKKKWYCVRIHLSLSIRQAESYPHLHILILSLIHTHTHTLSFSLSLSHSLFLSLSLLLGAPFIWLCATSKQKA